MVYQLFNLRDKTTPSSNTVEEVYDGDDPDATLDLTEPYIDELGRGEGEEDGERELGGGDSIERTESVVVGMKRRATEVCTCAHLYHHILEFHSVCVCVHSIEVCGVSSVSIYLSTLSVLVRYHVVHVCMTVCIVEYRRDHTV